MTAFLATIPFLRTLGVEFDGIDGIDGVEVRLAVAIGDHLRNGWQIAHGGVVMALADASLAAAARMVGGGRGLVTIEMKVSFMQPGHERLVATGRVLHRSSTMAFCEGEIHDADGQLVAKALGTFKYLRALPVGRRVARDRALHAAPGAAPGD
ncbi:PaaI family thioesterase [Chitinasiproducens palmae]|uniref:PaaI family thioesterase n=1 Tax=Chitinasiproducens palmae TaxID=1770053 RepID=UPI000A42761B